MKEILLKNDIIVYLQTEIDRVKRKDIECDTDNRFSYIKGYKEGQINELYKILNYVNGISKF